jgi:DNA-directed RNA polymerase specialized sigma24 family protein
MKGLSQEEIQTETNLTVGTIKTLVFRAKDKLKSFLTAQSPDLLLMDRHYNKKIKAIN